MLKTDPIIKLLEDKKESMEYNSIWENVKKEVIESLKNNLEESIIKTNLYMSMLEDERLIMIGDNNWDLKNKYSSAEQSIILRSRLTEEAEIFFEEVEEEETEETKELNLVIINEEEEE